MAEEGVGVAEEGVGWQRKGWGGRERGGVAEKGVGVAEKGVGVAEEGVGVAEEGVGWQRKGWGGRGRGGGRQRKGWGCLHRCCPDILLWWCLCRPDCLHTARRRTGEQFVPAHFGKQLFSTCRLLLLIKNTSMAYW